MTILILVSFALTGVIVLAVLVSVRHELGRSRLAEVAAKDVAPAFNFVTLAPSDARIGTELGERYVTVLSSVLVADYLESPAIRGVVDHALPPRRYDGSR